MSARRPWAWPLVPLYAAAQAAENHLRAEGILTTRKLDWPVISVGSLSAGGAGKTPVVLALARLLAERDWQPDILSRGYGRSRKGVLRVDPEAENAATLFGDEPTLLAARSGLPVWVASDRYAAGLAAEGDDTQGSLWPASASRRLHLLDDGFQHRELARDFDIVLVTAEDLHDTLLPAGNRREPCSALQRASAIVLREEESEALTEPIHALYRNSKAAGKVPPFWTLRRNLRFPSELGIFAAGLRPLAFCAIARPENFVAMLKAAGCGVIDAVTFRDHARYGPDEIDQIIQFASELKASGLLTTEKDAVKLDRASRQRLEEAIGPVAVVALEAEFIYSSPVLRTIETRLQAHAEAVEPVA